MPKPLRQFTVLVLIIGRTPSPDIGRTEANGKKMAVANAKGFGSGPNGGHDFKRGPEGSCIGNLTNGTVSVLTTPEDGYPFCESCMAGNDLALGRVIESLSHALLEEHGRYRHRERSPDLS